MKFKTAMLVNSVNRLKEFGASLVSVKEYMRSCLDWDYYPRSIMAFFVSLTRYGLTKYFKIGSSVLLQPSISFNSITCPWFYWYYSYAITFI